MQNTPQRCSVLPVKTTRRMKAMRNMSAAVESVCVRAASSRVCVPSVDQIQHYVMLSFGSSLSWAWKNKWLLSQVKWETHPTADSMDGCNWFTEEGGHSRPWFDLCKQVRLEMIEQRNKTQERQVCLRLRVCVCVWGVKPCHRGVATVSVHMRAHATSEKAVLD